MRILSVFFILLIAFGMNVAVVRAQDATMSASPSAQSSITYDLAYPGLLPDHPLHFFKVIRDKVVSSLINDPLKRAQFNLLTSDKRFNASIYLVNKNKDEQAVTTLSKSNNYLHDAIVALERADSIDQNTNDQKETVKTGIRKRYEISEGLRTKIDKDQQNAFDTEIERIETLEERVNKL